LRIENGQDQTAIRVPRSWGRYGRSRAARPGKVERAVEKKIDDMRDKH
jgi:hypothetical protein